MAYPNTTWPTTIDSSITRVNLIDIIYADDFNYPDNQIIQLQTWLGETNDLIGAGVAATGPGGMVSPIASGSIAFTLAARNAFVAGKLLSVGDNYDAVYAEKFSIDYAGKATAVGLTLGSTQPVVSIFDEDTMASDSDSALATQQSIKAYVDSVAVGFANPMTTVGDIIHSAAGPTTTRLGAGAAGQVLTAHGAATPLTWEDPPVAGVWDRTGTVLSPLNAGDTVEFSDGTVLLPGAAFVGQPATGLWRPAANEFGVAVKGESRYHITEFTGHNFYNNGDFVAGFGEFWASFSTEEDAGALEVTLTRAMSSAHGAGNVAYIRSSGVDAAVATQTYTQLKFNCVNDAVGAEEGEYEFEIADGIGGSHTTAAIIGRYGVTIVGDTIFTARAAVASTPIAGMGYVWTKTGTPTTLWFTDSGGTDVQLGAGGGGITTYTTVAAAELASGSDNDLCYVVDQDAFFRYEASGAAWTRDGISILNTADGGNTRWLTTATGTTHRSLTGNSVIIGHTAGLGASFTDFNVIIGYEANANGGTIDAGNVAIGWKAMENADGSGVDYNTCVGSSSGKALTAGYNAFYGSNSGIGATSAASNCLIGYSCGYGLTTGDFNTITGRDAGYFLVAGAENVMYGYKAGYRNYGSDNTFIGTQAGANNYTGSGNVFLGYFAGQDETGSNKLYIANSDTTTPLIQGDFSAAELTVNGDLTVTGDLDVSDDIVSVAVHNSYNTTDDTETTLVTITTTSDEIQHIHATIIGKQTDSANETNVYVKDFVIKNNGGSVTILTEQATYTHEDDATWDVVTEVDSTDVHINVIGPPANDVTWHSRHAAVVI